MQARVRRLAYLGVSLTGAVSACAHRAVETTAREAGAPADAALGEALVEVSDAEVDGGRGGIITVGAVMQTSVLDTPAWPETTKVEVRGERPKMVETGGGGKRLGYLRHGAALQVYEHPTVNDDCREGWFELVVGGFVCGKALSADLTSPRLRLAPRQPDRDAGMPYRYGVNLSDGTPLYRRVLPPEERKKYEPWLAPPPDPAPAAADNEGEKVEATEEEVPKHETAERDAGKRRLKDLKGRGVLVRKMARGFYLALDREFHTTGQRWWRTSFGFAVPYERIMQQTSVTKHAGTWFDLDPQASIVDAGEAGDAGDAGAPTIALTVGFVRHSGSVKLEVKDGKIGWGPELPKRSAVLLTGREVTISGSTVRETTGGFWVRPLDIEPAHTNAPPDVRSDEKWIDVDLTRQTLVAFVGKRPVFATLISSGRRNAQDKDHDFPTPTGTFHIREKHVTTTMDGDVASDGPYSIEDVPWVMYFQGSYALHGAFWHDAFGNMRSHGCVNMAPDDARLLFGWTDPRLPDGWHGVFSADENAGTRVVVHEDPRKKR